MNESRQTDESNAARLSRLCQACVQGQVAGAELELYAWRRDPDCPVAARILLATLLARRDQFTDALAVLPRRERLTSRVDAEGAMLLISLFVIADYREAARRLLGQLHREMNADPGVIDWIRLLRMPGADAVCPVAPSRADELGRQLVRRPRIIGALVTAQRIAPDPREIALLRAALERIAPDVTGDDHIVTLCTAMAQLAMLAGDADDARRWAHRGLRLNPYTAPLALLLADLSDDDAVGPPAADVLRRVNEKHPDYPDVRRALIRRELRDGQTATACMRIKQWLETEPQSPIANQLARESAA